MKLAQQKLALLQKRESIEHEYKIKMLEINQDLEIFDTQLHLLKKLMLGNTPLLKKSMLGTTPKE